MRIAPARLTPKVSEYILLCNFAPCSGVSLPSEIALLISFVTESNTSDPVGSIILLLRLTFPVLGSNIFSNFPFISARVF
jgi:hypothetical protein